MSDSETMYSESEISEDESLHSSDEEVLMILKLKYQNLKYQMKITFQNMERLKNNIKRLKIESHP